MNPTFNLPLISSIIAACVLLSVSHAALAEEPAPIQQTQAVAGLDVWPTITVSVTGEVPAEVKDAIKNGIETDYPGKCEALGIQISGEPLVEGKAIILKISVTPATNGIMAFHLEIQMAEQVIIVRGDEEYQVVATTSGGITSHFLTTTESLGTPLEREFKSCLARMKTRVDEAKLPE